MAKTKSVHYPENIADLVAMLSTVTRNSWPAAEKHVVAGTILGGVFHSFCEFAGRGVV
jgi:hypothetical protein